MKRKRKSLQSENLVLERNNGILGTVQLKLLATELLNEAIPIRVYEDRDRFELARIGIPETVYCYRNWFDFTIRRQLTGPDASSLSKSGLHTAYCLLPTPYYLTVARIPTFDTPSASSGRDFVVPPYVGTPQLAVNPILITI